MSDEAPIFRFTARVEPQPQPRPKFRVVKMGPRHVPVAYGDDAIDSYKAVIAFAAERAIEDQRVSMPWSGPVGVTIAFVFARPKSEIRKTKQQPNEWHCKRPDFDNLAKAVCDALNGICWIDDGQIAYSEIYKITAGTNERPRVVVSVWPMDEEVGNAAVEVVREGE